MREAASHALKPNCTQTPNAILDKLMPILSPAQFKLIMAICRKTYGWHKRSDDISLSQLEAMTGMSRQTIIDASTPLRGAGLIVIGRSGKRGVLNYSLNIDVDTESLVKQLDQSRSLTSLKNTTSLVQKLDTQKKLTKENNSVRIKRSRSVPKDTDSRITELRDTWAALYLARDGATKYHFSGKDFKLFQSALKTFSLPHLKELMGRFFENADSWVKEKAGFTVGVFHSKLNSLASTTSGTARHSQRERMTI